MSVEDAQGVTATQKTIQSNGKNHPKGLLSDNALRALLMLDFANPVFSWRRGILMQDLPQTTTLTQTASGTVYDLEQQFVVMVRKSSYATNTASPEYQFLQLYDNPTADSSNDVSELFQGYPETLEDRGRRIRLPHACRV